MAGASLLALLDDIATVLDDVAALTKVASKKTAGVLGDDLALNAQQVTGVTADRELPVVWAVAKGSFLNKAILVPAALAISALAHWAITPLLMVGGAYLCFEGVEKLAHAWLGSHEEEKGHYEELKDALHHNADLLAFEKEKVKGAIRTDFVLSAEIVAISLGVIADAPFSTQVVVLVGVAILMTVGVYGLVAGIVKIDDLGLKLTKRSVTRALGLVLLKTAPVLMKGLSVAGTVAMFLVGGGILVHGVHSFASSVESFAKELGGGVGALVPSLVNIVVGVVSGVLALGIVEIAKRVKSASAKGT